MNNEVALVASEKVPALDGADQVPSVLDCTFN